MLTWKKCPHCGHMFLKSLYPFTCPNCRRWHVSQSMTPKINPLSKSQVPPKWWIDQHMRPRFSVWDGRPLMPGQPDFPKPKKPFGW